MVARLLALLPHGHSLPGDDRRRRHRILLRVLAVHVPLAALVLGRLLTPYRRTSSVIVTIGLVHCSAALVGLMLFRRVTGPRRRVPQAGRAPELQRTAPAPPAAVVDVDASAAGALSRYRANREAACQLLDGGRA